MINLAQILENFEDGQNVHVCLSSGDEFILYDFEMVDESIYHRSDLVVATIRDVLKSEFKFRCETMIQLQLADILSLSDPETHYVFYSKLNTGN